jgi:hypothetical protein
MRQWLERGCDESFHDAVCESGMADTFDDVDCQQPQTPIESMLILIETYKPKTQIITTKVHYGKSKKISFRH